MNCRYVLLILMFSFGLATAQWQRCNMPYSGSASINAIAVDGNVIFAGGSSGLYESRDKGASWAKIILPPSVVGAPPGDTIYNKSISAIYAKGGLVFATSNNGFGNLLNSLDSGVTWRTKYDTLSNPNSYINASMCANSFLVIGNTAYVGSGIYGFYKSPDSGSTWASSDSGLPVFCVQFPSPTQYCYQDIAALVTNGEVLFLCLEPANGFGSPELPVTGRGIYRSADSGTSWTYKSSGLTDDSDIQCLAANGSYVFSGSLSAGISRSADSGDTWTVANSGLTDKNILALQSYGPYLFAGTQSKGVFLSRDSAKSWRPLNIGLTDTTITAFGLDSTYLYAGAGAPNGNFWRIPLSQVAVLKSSRVEPRQSGLKVLFSGKDATSIGIEFSLAHADKAHLGIYDLSGHLLATLLDKQLPAGEHAVAWDKRSAGSGCYVVRLEAGGKMETKAVPVILK